MNLTQPDLVRVDHIRPQSLGGKGRRSGNHHIGQAGVSL